MKLKKGDTVIVKAGKDAGKKAKIERLLPKTNQVVLPKLNKYKKHLKSQGPDKPGQTITLARPFSVSKLALICPSCHQPTRVGYLITKSGDKQRQCRKCQSVI